MTLLQTLQKDLKWWEAKKTFAALEVSRLKRRIKKEKEK